MPRRALVWAAEGGEPEVSTPTVFAATERVLWPRQSDVAERAQGAADAANSTVAAEGSMCVGEPEEGSEEQPGLLTWTAGGALAAATLTTQTATSVLGTATKAA